MDRLCILYYVEFYVLLCRTLLSSEEEEDFSLSPCVFFIRVLVKNIWLCKLLADLGLHVERKIFIYCDNLSSIQLARNPIFYAWTKHVEVHYHFIQECVLAGDIDLVYVSTQDQVEDIFTKALGSETLHGFQTMVGVHEMDLSLRGSVEMSSST